MSEPGLPQPCGAGGVAARSAPLGAGPRSPAPALRAAPPPPGRVGPGLSYAQRPRLSGSFAAVAKTRNEGVVAAVRRSGAAPRRTSPAAFRGLAGHAQSSGPLQLSEQEARGAGLVRADPRRGAKMEPFTNGEWPARGADSRGSQGPEGQGVARGIGLQASPAEGFPGVPGWGSSRGGPGAAGAGVKVSPLPGGRRRGSRQSLGCLRGGGGGGEVGGCAGPRGEGAAAGIRCGPGESQLERGAGSGELSARPSPSRPSARLSVTGRGGAAPRGAGSVI